MGDFRPRIAILLIAVLGCVAVLFFAQLTWRVFVLFDPTVFASVLFGEITKWSFQATTRGYQWDEPAFQDYFRRQANEAVEGLKSLVEVANEEQNLQIAICWPNFTRTLNCGPSVRIPGIKSFSSKQRSYHTLPMRLPATNRSSSSPIERRSEHSGKCSSMRS